LKLKPKHPMASYVKAKIFSSIGYDDEALTVLEPALDPAKPEPRVLDLLGELYLKAGRLDEAEKLYELGRKDDPQNSKWISDLARIHLRKKDPKLVNELVELANNDADNLALRKELAKRFTEAKDAPNAEHWGDECLYVDVYDPECHTLMADAYLLGKKPEKAVEEFDVALALKPKKADLIQVRRAKALHAAGKIAEAKAALEEILKKDPDHPEAKAALGEIK
jgi:predicted Zn-dependent protease